MSDRLTQGEALAFIRDLHTGAMAPASSAELEELRGYVSLYELERITAGRPDGSYSAMLEELRSREELAAEGKLELPAGAGVGALEVLPIPAPSQGRTFYRTGYRSTDGTWYSVGPWHDSYAAAEAWLEKRSRYELDASRAWARRRALEEAN